MLGKLLRGWFLLALAALPLAGQNGQGLGNSCGGPPGGQPSLFLDRPLQVGGQAVLGARNLTAPTLGWRVHGWEALYPGGIALDGLGMTGCSLQVMPQFMVPFASGTGSAEWVIPLPQSASLAGQSLFTQAFFFDPFANSAAVGATAGVGHEIEPQAARIRSVSSISQWGITWVFERPVPAGRFVNGDWFVVGEAKIIDILPRVTTSNGRTIHGAMLNPDPSVCDQGYDSRLYLGFGNHYQPQLNVALSVSSQNPLVLEPGNRVIKVISLVPNQTHRSLRTASVLTSLDEPPPMGSFRPPYAGPLRGAMFHEGMIQWSRLASLPPAAGVPSIHEIASRIERVWLDHCPSWIGRIMHPFENMPDYGRDLSSLLGVAALLANCDYPLKQRRELVIRLIQIGLDNYGNLRGGCRWAGDGGHSSGRKLPILFAGAMLGDQAMLAVGRDYRSQRTANGIATAFFGEDSQTFYVEETSPGVINFGEGGYLPSDIGLPDWGVNHTTEPQNDSRSWYANPYRRCCTANAWLGNVLVAHAMGLVPHWNHPPLFDYLDRYVAIEPLGWTRSWSSWAEAMWDQYRFQYP